MLRRWMAALRYAPNSDYELAFDGHAAGRRLLIFTEHVNATYFISFDLPLRAMHARGEVNVAVTSQAFVARHGGVDYAARCLQQFRPDTVIFTRYGGEEGAAMIDLFRQRGVPVIYHIDDDLLHVPDSLGAEIKQRQGAQAQARDAMLQRADTIYASTPYLAALLQARYPNATIFHGIYAPYMGDALEPVTAAPRPYPIMGYMGSKGHHEDLAMLVPQIAAVMEANPTLHFEVFGTIAMPEVLARAFPQRTRHYTVQKAYRDFLATLAGLQWDIGLAPLVDASFNRCKAPTKFIEYSAADIPTLASAIGVYEAAMPEGGGQLLQPGDWQAAMQHWLDHPAARAQALATARTHCAAHFSLHKLEQQLAKLCGISIRE
jgi:hypothetical protein